jgi:hypothetical protein
MGTFQSKRATHSRLPGESVIEGDDESDRAILEDDEGKGSGIMKTTKVTVVESEGSSHKGSQRSYKQSNDWASPNHDHGNSHAV